MSRSRLRIAVAVVAVPAALIAAFAAGLFVYVNATAVPIHPDPAAIPSTSRAPAAAVWAGAIEQARRVVRTGVTKQNLPGVSVAVGAAGRVVWVEGFGYADLDRKIAVTPETQFRIGDASIVLTSAAAGLLIERGQLSLDADVQKYVPDFPEKSWPVTVRELMAHTAGIRNDAGDEEPLEERCDRTADGLRRFAGDRLRFEPGTRFAYSSYGWILVSAALESAANMPFFAFMQSQVFEPLGMAATKVYRAAEKTPDLSTFYFPRFGGDTRYGPEPAREGDHACFAGAGAFLSTPSDLVRFGMAVGGGTLLKPATVELLQTPQRLTSGEPTGYGLGWTLETIALAGESAVMAGHGTKRDFIGGTTSLATFPQHGLVVAVTSNTSFADTRSLAVGVAEAFAAELKKAVRK